MTLPAGVRTLPLHPLPEMYTLHAAARISRAVPLTQEMMKRKYKNKRAARAASVLSASLKAACDAAWFLIESGEQPSLDQCYQLMKSARSLARDLERLMSLRAAQNIDRYEPPTRKDGDS